MPYTIQGNSAGISQEPMVQNGRTYVPLREVLQQLGGSASWDNSAKQATATIANWVATVSPDETSVNVTNSTDGSVTPVTLNGPPILGDDGELWVPASYFQTAYGYQVGINGSDITIVNPNG